MAKQTSEARYDTCECVLLYQWDDSTLSAARIHTGFQALRLCARHQGVLAPLAFTNATADNQVKNDLYALVVAVKPTITPEDYRWTLRLDRVLEVNLLLNPGEKAQLLAAANAKVGLGKVVVP